MIIEIENHNNYPANLGYKTFIKYFPTRYSVGEDYKSNRTIVYNFKDGIINNSVDTLFINAINSIKSNDNFWLCPIPSSTVLKTKDRFFNFCARISQKSGINNGFQNIQSNEDRTPVHTGDSRDYSNVISCIKFKEIRGKNIILCDDVVTTGRSFKLIANQLISLGALSVRGLILAKTHWLKDEGISFSISEEGELPDSPPPNVPPDLEYREYIDDFSVLNNDLNHQRNDDLPF